MSKAPFPINPVMTAIVVAYKNKRLIADEVLPYVPVGKAEFKYLVHNLAEGFTVPNTFVGRKSRPNMVEFSATEVTDSCHGYGLDDVVPQDDIDNAPENYNPLNHAAEGLIDLVLLDREVRTSGMVFNNTKYASSNKLALSGSDRFDDYIASDPIEVIKDSLSSMLLRANVAVMGRKVFDKLSSHPKIVKAVHGNSGDSGVVKRKQIADLFELDDVLVGEAFLNVAKKGETMSLTRVWGPHIALVYQDRFGGPGAGNGRMTFGFTARFGSRFSGTIPDQHVGLRGGHIVRSGEQVKEVITSDRLGYLIENAVS